MPHVSGLELIEQLKGDSGAQAHPDHGGHRLCRQGRRGADPRRRRGRLCVQADLGGPLRRGGAGAAGGAEAGGARRDGGPGDPALRGAGGERCSTPGSTRDGAADGCSRPRTGEMVRVADRAACRRPLRDRRAARRRGGPPHRRLRGDGAAERGSLFTLQVPKYSPNSERVGDRDRAGGRRLRADPDPDRLGRRAGEPGADRARLGDDPRRRSDERLRRQGEEE